MKGKKLAFAVILALIVCLVLIPVSAYAAEGEPAESGIDQGETGGAGGGETGGAGGGATGGAGGGETGGAGGGATGGAGGGATGGTGGGETGGAGGGATGGAGGGETGGAGGGETGGAGGGETGGAGSGASGGASSGGSGTLLTTTSTLLTSTTSTTTSTTPADPTTAGDLITAVNSAANVDTIKLGDNIVVTERLTLNNTANADKTITIDFGGKSLTRTTEGEYAIGFRDGATYILKNGTINGGIQVACNSKLTIDSSFVVNGHISLIGELNDGTQAGANTELNIYGKVYETSAYDGYDAVNTNGSCNGGAINIYDGAVIESTNNIAVYLPSGSLTVNGGSLSGTTGIYMRAGSLVMNGGSVSAHGEKKAQVFESGHATATGDAIVIEYPASGTFWDMKIDKVEIKAGTVTSDNAEAVAEYVNTNKKADNDKKAAVTGGIYSDDSALDYVADGNVVVKVGEQYGVNGGAFELGDIAAENGEVIEILAAPDGTAIDGVIPGVKFVNKSGNDVFVNGVKIAAGETYTVPGAEFTYTEAYTAKYFVVDGEEQEWTKGSADGLTFKLNSEDVIKVLIDGVEVEFTVENGEIVISAEVLEALEAGEHEIEFVFVDGSCKTVFTVK